MGETHGRSTARLAGAGLVCVLAACGGGPGAPDSAIPRVDGGSPTLDAEVATDAGADGGGDAGEDGGDGDAGVEPPPPLELVAMWGGYGTEPGQFIEPSSVELDSEGFVYVAGHENRFQKFTADGELVAIYGEAGTADGQFNHPHGLAVDRRRGDLIYVGDQNNHRLQVFETDGSFVRGWGDDDFVHIHDVGIDPASGDLFVGDYELDTVRRFDATGALVSTWGGTGRGPGEFNGVWGISTDSAGRVYVADTFNRRLQVFDRDGRFLAQWADFEGTPFDKPTGVFVDALDRVYLCDSTADSILVFATDGRPLERWDLAPIVGFDAEPEDIVLDPTGVDLWVGEVREHRVMHLRRTE